VDDDVVDEVVVLGFDRSYPTLTRQLRLRWLCPHCEACTARRVVRRRSSSTRPVRRPSETGSISRTRQRHGGWRTQTSLFVGPLAHSRRWRGVLAESKDQPHTINALDRIPRALAV
jgi:hypothetical protein